MSALIADRVIQAPKSRAVSGRLLRRKCACGTHTPAGGQCDGCTSKQGNLQRKAIGQRGDSAPVPALVNDVLRSSGAPLDSATRAFFEPRFGRDFSGVPAHAAAPGGLTLVPGTDRSEREADATALRVMRSAPAGAQTRHDFGSVRIHTDPVAARSARAMNARAYTVGSHVVFAEGQYDAATTSGRELIAHELAHVAGGTAGSGAVNCKRFETDEAACTATMTYLVQLLFKDNGKDAWTEARKKTFRSDFKAANEATFNGNAFRIKPDAASYQSGLVFQETKSCPCAAKGFKPVVQVDLVDEGKWSVSEDWEVDVAANAPGVDLPSETYPSYGYLDEADTKPIAKISSAPGVKQIPAAHELGHFMGLDHPGAGLEGGFLSPSQLSPGANQYGHTGKDRKGRTVDGPNDLMGAGMGLRAFYYDNWRDALNDKYGSGCGWKTS
jgi:hypothetical protein